MSHFIGIAVGYGAWRLMSIASGQPVSLETHGWVVFAGPSLAMAVVCVLLVRLSCPHPPACGSALVTPLGAADGWAHLLGMVAGVVLLTLQAVLISRLAGVSTPLWSSRERAPQHE